ncbi:dolichol kinase [Moniliophthora roreri]|nr:dolichol kinase [Moniliophthora roreri]
MDWSTSYQAGSSGSQSEDSLDDSDDEILSIPPRGRTFSQSSARNGPIPVKRTKATTSSSRRRPSPYPTSSGESSAPNGRMSFTRSKSPAMQHTTARFLSLGSQLGFPLLDRHKSLLTSWRHVLPATFELGIRIPFTSYTWSFSLDSRRAGESIIILYSLVYGSSKIWEETNFPSLHFSSHTYNLWILTELQCLIGITVLYMLWAHNSLTSNLSSIPSSEPPDISPTPMRRPASPRISESREQRRSPPSYLSRKKSDFGFVWMSVPKNYRNSSDDGICTGLLFGPLVSCALLYGSLSSDPSADPLPPTWRIEAPASLKNSRGFYTPLEALVLSRYSAVDLSVMCSSILLLHVVCSWWLERRFSSTNTVDGERKSVPRSEGRRMAYYVLFSIGVTFMVTCMKISFQELSLGFWMHLTWLEVAISSLFYQFTLYVAVRLAHRGFTLGELGMVCFGGTALFMELLNLTRAQIWPLTTPFIKTFRLPTPLLLFQIALVAGSFLTGFMLSPFLVLSRHIAQRPIRRLRYPEQKLRYRRRLALGFYIGAVIIVVGLIGMWTRWCLNKRDPWLWAIFWLLEGRKKWSRPALLVYWGLLGSLSVAGWNRQLARSRRFRTRNSVGENLIVPGVLPADTVTSTIQGTGSGNESPSTLTGTRVAFDPAFTHLCFSAAFALFTFAEYVRYFAIYPFGASIHLFMNEFLDQKDSGTAILSHFYLLTGCAGSLWLENSEGSVIVPECSLSIRHHSFDSGSPLLEFTGILVLGVGDALASIVGKRVGIHRWSPTSSKTLEGSVAFTVSVVICAWVLRLFGIVEAFSTYRYAGVIGYSSVLEALSDQNDNLTLPLFAWSLSVLVGIR